MATPAEVMQAVCAATGVPLATVVDIDRRLVKGGLRTKSGRGFNVAQVTPLDAARLLTAILASPLATNAVEAVQRYADAIVDPKRSTPALFKETGIDELATLPGRHSYIEAVAALIASVASGPLSKQAKAEGTKLKIELFAFTGATYGRLRLSGLPGDISANVEYLPPAPRRRSDGDSHLAGDLEQSRRITERTILAVGQLLGKERKNEPE